jgi:Ca2+-binding RTX toxin-like protein
VNFVDSTGLLSVPSTIGGFVADNKDEILTGLGFVGKTAVTLTGLGAAGTIAVDVLFGTAKAAADGEDFGSSLGAGVRDGVTGGLVSAGAPTQAAQPAGDASGQFVADVAHGENVGDAGDKFLNSPGVQAFLDATAHGAGGNLGPLGTFAQNVGTGLVKGQSLDEAALGGLDAAGQSLGPAGGAIAGAATATIEGKDPLSVGKDAITGAFDGAGRAFGPGAGGLTELGEALLDGKGLDDAAKQAIVHVLDDPTVDPTIRDLGKWVLDGHFDTASLPELVDMFVTKGAEVGLGKLGADQGTAKLIGDAAGNFAGEVAAGHDLGDAAAHAFGAGADALINKAGLPDQASGIASQFAHDLAEGKPLDAALIDAARAASGDWFDASGLNAGVDVHGLGGADTFVSGIGADIFDGGADRDVIAYTGGRENYRIEALPGEAGSFTVTDVHSGVVDTIRNVETVTFGLGGDQTSLDLAKPVTGQIIGTEGADTLVGTSSAELIEGRGGDDTLVGSAGSDAFDGGAGTDTVSYEASPAAVAVNLATGVGHGGDAQGDTYVAIEKAIGSVFDDTYQGGANLNWFTGGDGNDTMTGGSYYDVLDGGNGNDTFIGTGGFMLMHGGDGQDTMIGSLNNGNYFDGGAGDDIMTGGNSTDYMADVNSGDDIMHAGGEADVMIDFNGIAQMFGEAGDDQLYASKGSGVLDGGAGNDYLSASNGIYALLGGDGNDTLEAAGTGEFTFTGGAGADVFTYRIGMVNPVKVTDFEDGKDHIYLWDNHYYGNVPFESLQISDSADGAIISFYGGSQMIFAGITASQLTKDDFVFTI